MRPERPRWLKGRPVADRLQAEIQHRAQQWSMQGVQPTVAVLVVQGDAASASYAAVKQRAAAKLGIRCLVLELPSSATQSQAIDAIAEWNADPHVHGIIVELPLPAHMNTAAVVSAIHPGKDIDGLTPANRLAVVTGDVGLYPATPLACIALAKAYGYELAGRAVTLIGRGKTVGLPLLHLLLRENATVTICHSHTPDLTRHLQTADIAFVAVGRAGLITPEMVHPDLVIIDAGVNQTTDGRLVGDVETAVADVVQAMSPTPGGVGPITTMQLFRNLMDAMNLGGV